jgi:hypothetical protein
MEIKDLIKITPEINLKKQSKKDENIIDVDYTEIK